MNRPISTLSTEWLINKTRYFFIGFFAIAGFISFRQGSHYITWGSVWGTTIIFLILALVNHFFIKKKILSETLIWISVTIEFSLIFTLKFFMHFDPSVGYGMTIKEPATFLVYFLFMIMTALRYSKKLNIYSGILAVTTYVLLLVLAITEGGMVFAREPEKFFHINTLRLASEAPKILFLLAFVFFMTKMADFTNTNIDQLAETEKKSHDDYNKMKEILKTIEESSDEMVHGSKELSTMSTNIDGILNQHGGLMKDVNSIIEEINENISQIKEKSQFQFETAETNFSRIKETSELMIEIHDASFAQTTRATEAIKLANINEEKINETINAITGMKENSKKIEEISKTISEIADQTNLLSLNAAIESARAGEHGKGFAVVADEISKLASMSIDSSKEIATIIKSTVKNIENSSDTIENLSQYLNEIIDFVKTNSSFMSDLKDKTEKEMKVSKTLYSSTTEVKNAAQEVISQTETQIEKINNISTWLKNMNALGGEVADTLRNLQTLSTRLQNRSDSMNSLLSQEKN
jgi:methyl-accepting chemotaxis protein